MQANYLDEKYIEENADIFDWHFFSTQLPLQDFSEKFIEKFECLIEWKKVIFNKKTNLDFFEKIILKNYPIDLKSFLSVRTDIDKNFIINIFHKIENPSWFINYRYSNELREEIGIFIIENRESDLPNTIEIKPDILKTFISNCKEENERRRK